MSLRLPVLSGSFFTKQQPTGFETVHIATVCRSIIGEVRYNVERLTGVDVKNVDIYVESIKAD